mmetsp:Transcript_8064/g.19490  ORF Transcript_8064/g.19490 Transcript_8064/m.19490 type:complete len:308 (-) Transcript_8064:1679-2602(-)
MYLSASFAWSGNECGKSSTFWSERCSCSDIWLSEKGSFDASQNAKHHSSTTAAVMVISGVVDVGVGKLKPSVNTFSFREKNCRAASGRFAREMPGSVCESCFRNRSESEACLLLGDFDDDDPPPPCDFDDDARALDLEDVPFFIRLPWGAGSASGDSWSYPAIMAETFLFAFVEEGLPPPPPTRLPAAAAISRTRCISSDWSRVVRSKISTHVFRTSGNWFFDNTLPVCLSSPSSMVTPLYERINSTNSGRYSALFPCCPGLPGEPPSSISSAPGATNSIVRNSSASDSCIVTHRSCSAPLSDDEED